MIELGTILFFGGLLLFLVRFELLSIRLEKLEKYVQLQHPIEAEFEFDDEETRG